MASVYERITNALSSLGKRRERDSGTDDGGRNTPGGNSRAPKRFRPWEQADLHRRLETFKPLTWLSKPDSVGPVPCALRGWINDAYDSLCCEHCNTKLIYPPNVSYDQRQAAADLFSPSLSTKHSSTCPWRQTQCNPSLLAYIPNNTHDELRQVFQALHGKLLKVDVLPDIDAIAIQAIHDAAMPYGSYDDLMMGIIDGTGTGGASGNGYTTRRRTAVDISVVTDEPHVPSTTPAPSEASPNSSALTATATTPTYIIQPSKLSPQQKARLLALLGWDVDVLQPNSARASASQSYTQSAGYSLHHLGVKPKIASATGVGCGGSPVIAKDRERHSMSTVVLKCQHCNCRTGLWNFAGLRPVPTGRLTPPQQASGVGACHTPAGADPLSATIAGGQYSIHGTTAPRPFGATSSMPFRFGSTAPTEPVFGIAALDAAAQRQKQHDLITAAGFGSPIGRKRKASEIVTPEPMATDASGPRTPPFNTNATDPKRARLGSFTFMGTSPLSGLGQTPGALAEDPQAPRELDPMGQHRSWCPWVYTGSREQPQMSGWQHMLRALSQGQQQSHGEADVLVSGAEAPMDASQSGAASTPTAPAAGAMTVAGMDGRQLRDGVLAVIRSL